MGDAAAYAYVAMADAIADAGLTPAAVDGVNVSTWVSRLNPRSVVQPDAENARRQAELEQWLRAEGYVWFGGHSIDPRGVWPNEPCVLILGIRHADACGIGKHFDQNAIVWCPPTAVPELVMLATAADS